MTDLMESVYFRNWIADTVAECGGNRAQCLRYLERERSLTCCETTRETRMDAMSIDFEAVIEIYIRHSMRESAVVLANLMRL